MKASTYRELNVLDLEAMLVEKLESLQNFKFQQALQQITVEVLLLQIGTLVA